MRKIIQGDWTFKWYQHKEMIMDNNTSNIELGTTVIYSFKSEIHRGAGEIVDYSKTLTTPSDTLTSLEEIQANIEECEQKWLDLKT